MAGFRTSFGDWTVRLRTRPAPAVLVVSHKGEDKRTIGIDNFEEKGMILFPAGLLKMIRKEIRHANSYDRLVDKFYDWYDYEW